MQKIACLCLVLSLSGCSTYSETFDCPPGLGVGCKSLSDVNQMVEDGTLPVKVVSPKPVKLDKSSSPKSSQVPDNQVTDKRLKVWMRDPQGNYSHVYLPEKKV